MGRLSRTLFRGKILLAAVALAVPLAAMATPALAWGHQGHILITRLAALRIINDPNSPPALVAFLKTNMKYDMEACKKLATELTINARGENYTVGLDGACTLPDRIIPTPEGEKIIEPYGAPEAKMHFMDMEWLSKEPIYKADLSNRPQLSEISHDLKDPRWKMAGFVPFRVEECYKKTVAAFGAGDKPLADNAEALKWLGYLCHYIEDSHQPLHATIDYRSYSYLAGKVKQVKEIRTPTDNGGFAISYRAEGAGSRNINPHGDLEFQLFNDDEEPRKTFRQEFWKELVARIDAHAKAAPTNPPPAPPGTFMRTLQIISDSYDYLPAVGKAAQAGYATGKFDAEAFFTSTDTVHGQKIDTVQLIAERNAAAVIEVEKTIRQAWADSKAQPNSRP